MDRERLRRKLPWFALAAACLAADLWTKHLVFYPDVLEPGFREGARSERFLGLSWWNTILVYNQGVTFGSLAWVPAWVKSTLTGGVIAWMAWKLWTLREGRPAQATALAMIVGGAVGNLYDRALRPSLEPDANPGVRDFLDWHLPADWAVGRWWREQGWNPHWYTSNVADVLIVCGVILLAWCLLREPDEDAAPRPAEARA